MKILVTGGAGFIGSHTCERFVKAGHQVAVADNLSSGKLANLEAVRSEINFINLDIQDFEMLSDACHDMEVVLHLAAIPSVVVSIERPAETDRVNTGGTLNVIEACRRGGARRLIIASSAAVYGDSRQLPFSEQSQTRPLSPYGWQKLSGEYYGRFFGQLAGTEFVALRYFNVYGLRQDPASPYSGVLSIFARQALRQKSLTVYGDGSQTRDFVHVSDIAEVNLRAVETGRPLPDVINVGGGRETSIAEAAAIILKHAGGGAPIVHKQKRPSDIYRSFAAIGRLRDCLGYAPQVAIEAGLKELLAEG